MNNHIFNSFTLPVPPLRYELEKIPIQQNGHSLIYFYDSLGYATSNFALPGEADVILSLFDGTRSVSDILLLSSNEISKEDILSYVQFLDEHNLLDSAHFSEQAEAKELEYESSQYHQPVTVGHSYPSDASELQAYFDEAFKKYAQTEPVKKAKALYAPHIDTTVGLSSYVKAFSAIRKLKPKRVVILATSHYSGLYGDLYDETPFIVVDKTFAMPNGDISTDKETIYKIRQIASQKNIGVSFHDRAHRIEHSIELHLLFLNYIWNHAFNIVPILVGGLDELLYLDHSYRAVQVDSLSKLLKKEFGDDEDTMFLISGDLSHFGKKFGDDKSAHKLLSTVQEFDQKFMQKAVENSAEGMRRLLKTDFDSTRICGFPPLQTFLHTLPNLKGTLLSYDVWDETERESAVSFCSILYT